jgi:hypothetical protein
LRNPLKEAPLVAGARIEIDLATLGNIFFDNQEVGTSPPTDYSVEDIYLDLESVALMDSASASVNANAQKRSLEYLYHDIFTSRNASPSNSSSINVDINKSVSYATKVWSVIQTDGNQNDVQSEGYSTPYVAGKWWYHLGSLQYPAVQQIDNDKVAYANNLVTWNKNAGKCGERGETEMTLADYKTKYGSYSACLEMDTALALSALPVTSSRTLRFEASLDNPLTNNSTTIVFMNFLTSARCTLTSCKVDI